MGMQTHVIAAVTALFFMTLVFIGFLKHISDMFFSESPHDFKSGEGSVWLIIPPITLLIVIAILSFYIPPFLLTLINNAASAY